MPLDAQSVNTPTPVLLLQPISRPISRWLLVASGRGRDAMAIYRVDREVVVSLRRGEHGHHKNVRGGQGMTELFWGDETFYETLGASDCNQKVPCRVVVLCTLVMGE